jgi:hypothetical protein
MKDLEQIGQRSLKMLEEIERYVNELRAENRRLREFCERASANLDGSHPPSYQLMCEIVEFLDEEHS